MDKPGMFDRMPWSLMLGLLVAGSIAWALLYEAGKTFIVLVANG